MRDLYKSQPAMRGLSPFTQGERLYTAVLVTALFNFYNRLVDGVGLALPDGYVAEAAKTALDPRIRRLRPTREDVTIPSSLANWFKY
jgi:hypothetical protein